jgi:FAD synthase
MIIIVPVIFDYVDENEKSQFVIARNIDDAIWYVRYWGIPEAVDLDFDLNHPNGNGKDFLEWLIFYDEEHSEIKYNFDFRCHSGHSGHKREMYEMFYEYQDRCKKNI